MKKILTYTVASFLMVWMAACTSYHRPDGEVAQCPQIVPDYAGVTFPVNIAPPNFRIAEAGDAYQIEIGQAPDGEASMVLHSDDANVTIPQDGWKELLKQSAGGKVYFRISILQEGKWMRYADVVDSISPHLIDPYLAYRLIYPGYELWNEMGIYQRDLTSYEQTAIAENKDFGKQCINCHTFNGHSPETMMFHVRGAQGGTVIYRNGQLEKVNPKPEGFQNGATYPAWHPSGKYIAFSANNIVQSFHAKGQKPIEVADKAADLFVYEVDGHTSFTDSLVYGDTYMETFPTWTPDGKTLYFCRAQGYREGMPVDSIRYDLCSIRFDEAKKQLHTLECVYEASAGGHSVSFPRVSPDGRYLMFVQSDYGNFSIWHPESELYLLDLTTGDMRPLSEVNSDDVESFHTWSSSGRWFVFSSKRMDGLWARPYFAAFNPETGRAAKPFVLPHEDPDYYDNFMYTYNLPELIKEPVRQGRQMVDGIAQPARQATGPK